MLRLSDASNFRRTAAGICLILAPLLLLVNSLITTVGGDNTERYLALVADRRGAEELSAVLGILGFTLLIPGILGALNLLRGRGVVLGHIGAALAVLGLGSFCALLASSFFDVAATAPGADTQAYAELADSIEDQAGAIVIVVIALLGTLIGLILLGAAFIRARTAPVWAGAALIVAAIMLAVFGGGDSRIPGVIASAVLLAGLAAIGLELLRRSDDEWDAPAPAIDRPAATAEVPQPSRS